MVNLSRARGHHLPASMARFNAENDIQAEALSKLFRGDITVLENEGQPLWNGADEIFVRKALPAEETRQATQMFARVARAVTLGCSG
jgi:hypothetical protein